MSKTLKDINNKLNCLELEAREILTVALLINGAREILNSCSTN